ncbi:Kinesin-like protein kin-7f [Thalictrum thalictroides]|uniref:Kinesin-like protein n=1 Tax=Thalictrum thalictroides TaxID=46969 RepID=A0A7J6WD80_THATH|nr:Kinesin-like protein kin-7f [Thalictrum thalictroides]
MGSIAGDELMHLEKTTEVGGQEERILVSVRLRPLNGKEFARNDVSDWETINDNTLIYRNSLNERSMYPNAYTFDRVFGCDSPTKKVYDEAAKEVALSVVSGINASIFAYGQTSSGKTYTMSGITEFTVEDIYDYVQRHDERTFILKFSAMEIYNEAVRDLLSSDNTPLRLLDDPERGTVVDKLTEETLRDLNHLKELLSLCEAQRQIGETSLNEMSSRSHQILRLTIESSAREFIGKDNSSTLAASVDFVDLAGSERASQAHSAGTRLKEGCHINRSLLTLGTVVRKLSKGKNGHVPYRDSKLTRILQCSLGGNARTAIICTISPARSHVEQSRNTLSFASCAKEVATNAQVNVVISDKALVKHLQRELARLEGELSGLGPSSATDDSTALLKEKDLQIEKMEKQIKELTLQRDLAQSRLVDLIQVGDDQSSESSAKINQYPILRVTNAFLNDPVSAVDHHCLDEDVKRSNRSQGSYEFIEHPIENTEDTFLFDGSSPRFSTISSKYVCPDPIKGWEGITQGCGDEFEELCKDVRCIELEETDTNRIIEPVAFRIEEDDEMFTLRLTELDQICIYDPHKRNEELSKAREEYTYGAVEQKCQDVQTTIDCVNSHLTEKSSHWPEKKDLSITKNLNLPRSKTCRASLMNGSSTPSLPMEVKIENTPSCGTEKDFPERPGAIEKKYSILSYNPDSSYLSRDSSLRSDLTEELKAQNINKVVQNDRTSIHTFVAGLKEMNDRQYEKQLVKDQAEETESRTSGSEKTVKDVGVDPMHVSPDSYSSWPMEFERQQMEIIELWQSCHVSLVHRTYFFLLFKGDPSDSIYMEVERRRLSFLRDLYAQGNKLSIEGAGDITLASSVRALRREREMLSKQMQKRMSEKERDNIYTKWGIGLKSKQRRVQLTRRLWTETKDMNHIVVSANIVAKLVGLPAQKQALKEMFTLSFTPQKPSRRSYSWKSSSSSIQ